MLERLIPPAASAHAADVDRVMSSIHLHMGLQAVAWGAFFIVCLIRFRQGARPPAQGPVRPLLPVIAIAAVIAGDAVLLATAAVPAWLERLEPPTPLEAPLEVRVVAEQFAWNIHYPGPDGVFGEVSNALISASNPLGINRTDRRARDDIGLRNVMMLPLGRPVIVYLASRDVVHSFTLHEMRVKLDATPGLVVRTWFTPIVPGQWDIGCSQLCGLGHYRMRGEYSVLTAGAWNRWLQSELRLLEKSLGANNALNWLGIAHG